MERKASREEVKQAMHWVDVERFSSACTDDGRLWKLNAEVLQHSDIALSFLNEERPRWFTYEDFNDEALHRLETMELEELWKSGARELFFSDLQGKRSTGTVFPLTRDIVSDQFLNEDDYCTCGIPDCGYGICYCVEPPLDEVKNNGMAYAAINMHAPDSTIMKDFSTWLAATRKGLSITQGRKSPPATLKHLKRNQVFPYMWLKRWEEEHGVKIKQTDKAYILFRHGGENGISPLDTLRKGTEVFAKRYFKNYEFSPVYADEEKLDIISSNRG